MSLLIRLRALVLGVTRTIQWLPPLVARLTLGYVFIHSGIYKFGHLRQIIGFFTGLHMPAPGFMVRFVASNELIFGILVLLGLATRFAVIPLAVTMVVALVTAKAADIHTFGDLLGTGEYLNIVLLLWLMVAGAGDASVDRYLARRMDAKGKA